MMGLHFTLVLCSMNRYQLTCTHMKLSHQHNKPSRFFTDRVFRGGVRASALLVIMTFLALILTLIYRAAPILYTPEVTFTKLAPQQAVTVLTDNTPALSTMQPHDVHLENVRLMSNRFELSHHDHQIMVRQLKTDFKISFPVDGELMEWQISQQPNVFYVQIRQQENESHILQIKRIQLLSHPKTGLAFQEDLLFKQAYQSIPPLAVVGENDIHNIIHVVYSLDGQKHYLMLNSVTLEPLNHQRIEGLPKEVNLSEVTVTFYRNKLVLHHDQFVFLGEFSALHSAITIAELLSPQQYVGYYDAEYLWQTNPSLDFQDRKYNIMPLLIGSAKASLLALLVAIPLALGSAIYVGYFAPRVIQRTLKPMIEVLEAIPSVAIGLIAAIWLVPLTEAALLSFLLFIVLLPVMLLSAHGVFLLAKWFGLKHIFVSMELGLQVFLILALVWFCFEGISGPLNDMLLVFAIDTISLDKSTLVVAVALGIAISPTIFSLAEDALSGVSNSMIKAAAALGATRLQTLQYVLLPAAAPGIIAAVMIGLGRAFGETMIVLMVTGNTPIAQWDIFAGLRALSANLVIELPEANHMNSHMTVLFVTALLLFLFTFVLNSVAELIKYRYTKSLRGLYD
jgi:ABC-type uncharacterized transport system permease subunit